MSIFSSVEKENLCEKFEMAIEVDKKIRIETCFIHFAERTFLSHGLNIVVYHWFILFMKFLLFILCLSYWLFPFFRPFYLTYSMYYRFFLFVIRFVSLITYKGSQVWSVCLPYPIRLRSFLIELCVTEKILTFFLLNF